MGLDDLPESWTVWNEQRDGRIILAYRPDVFDAEEFPAPCLPTIYVTNGSRADRPGAGQYATEEWHATLFAEPEIELTNETRDSRSTAVDAAVDVADRFANGEIDYRAAYQQPREAYLAELDERTGRAD
ncbi:DUF5820 family protein [Halolamina sediminis]|uniref:DUF5820 family protein n=1 Tax=Halolamina sediminis TaxID=1480675 RepID=UPI0006B4777C|nr:DUF5820 family protein [Halolamina sediminis]